MFLVAAVFWSLTNILGRSHLLLDYKLLLCKIVVCAFTLAAAQFHCFISSYYPPNKGRWLPLAYASLAIMIFLVAMGYVPEDVIVTGNNIYPVYGNGIFLMGLPLAILTVRNVYFLWQRLKFSDDPALRNQTAYLLLSIGILTVAVFTTFTTWGNEVPVSHIGNLINAVILTYAVVVHRLLDIRVVFRRGIVWTGLIIAGIGIYVLLLFLIHWVTGVKFDERVLTLTTLATIVVGVIVYLLQKIFSRSADRFFYRARYNYRQKLHDFLQHKISGVFSLRELSEELLPLITGALGCNQVYLLLPDPESGDFVAEFSLSQSEDVSPLIIKKDNPVMEWLKRENRYLSKENLDILPEFRGIWAEEKEGLEALDMELLFPLINRTI